MMQGMLRISLIFAVLLCTPLVVSAHDSGASFEKTVGTILVDIGYDVPFSIATDTLLDFSLTQTDGRPVPYTSIIISVESGSIIQWKKAVTKPDFGRPIASLLPERAGHWNLHAVFMDEASIVADASFPVEIAAESPRSHGISPVSVVTVALMLTAAFAYTVFIRKRS